MNAKSTLETPEVLKKIYDQKLVPGSAIAGLAAATGTSYNLAGLAISSTLGGLAGPSAYIEGPLGEPVHPGFNLLVAGHDPKWHQLQRVVLGAVEPLQRQLREIGQITTEDSVTKKPHEDGNRNLGKEIRESFDKHLFENSPTDFILDHARPCIALRQPSMVMISPTPESFTTGVGEILDREVAVYFPHGGLFAELNKFSPSRRWHQFLGQLVQAMEGSDASFQPICENSGFGCLSTLRARLLMTCDAAHVRDALTSNNSDVQRFLRQCLIIRPNRWRVATSLQPLELKGGYARYMAAVRNVMANRRCGQSSQLTVDAAGYNILSQYGDFLRAKSSTVNLPGHPWIMDFHWRLMWSMKVLCPGAGDIASAALANGLALLETARRPVAFTEKLAPKKIAKAIRYCFDGAVFLGDPISDLVPSFAALRAMEQHDFAKMIRASWSGLPPFTGDEFILGATTLFWVIEEASLFPLFDIEVVTEAPMPVLWITSPRNGPCGGKLSSEKAWSDYIHRILLFRQKRTCAQFSLNVEAAAVLGEFERQIAGLDPEGPCGIARHLAFLPELAVRFAVLLEVCKEVKGNEQVITEESATAAVRLTRWLAQEHLEVLRNHLPAIKPYTDSTACADESSPEEVMQRKIERRGSLTTRELWRSYNKPRAQWFHATLNSLIQSGKVIRTPDQRLTLAVRR